jgi:hypothetical protein
MEKGQKGCSLQVVSWHLLRSWTAVAHKVCDVEKYLNTKWNQGTVEVHASRGSLQIFFRTSNAVHYLSRSEGTRKRIKKPLVNQPFGGARPEYCVTGLRNPDFYDTRYDSVWLMQIDWVMFEISAFPKYHIARLRHRSICPSQEDTWIR